MRTIFTLIALFISTLLYCQVESPKITISNEKVKQNGVVKYVHKVKKGETLYSLSKAYEVTIDEIVQNNESLKNGLKDGSIIFIPLSGVTQKEENKTIIDTLGTTPAAYYKDSLNFKLVKHTRRWYQDINDIAKKYKVPVDALIAFNGLKTTKLKKRQKLFIPPLQYISDFTESLNTQDNKVNITLDSLEINSDSLNNNTEVFLELDPKNAQQNINVSYILPLNSNNLSGLSSNFMDFYSGSLLALNYIKQQGYNINVNVIDQNSVTDLSSINNNSNIEKSDIIIGPIKDEDIIKLLPIINELEIPLVSPMDQGAYDFINGNKFLIQSPVSDSTQLFNIVNKLINQFYIDEYQKVILISEENGNDLESVNFTKQILTNNNIPYENISYGILQGRNILSNISLACTKNNNNLIIVPSKSEAFVNDVVRNLNLLYFRETKNSNTSNFDIKLYGMPKWKNFSTIEPEHFHNLSLHLALPYFVDYTNNNVKNFLYNYRGLFKTEPTPYSYQGYDITKYFLEIIGKYGKGFINSQYIPSENMLQSNFNFVKDNPYNGMKNISTVNVIYNKDYTITIID